MSKLTNIRPQDLRIFMPLYFLISSEARLFSKETTSLSYPQHILSTSQGTNRFLNYNTSFQKCWGPHWGIEFPRIPDCIYQFPSSIGKLSPSGLNILKARHSNHSGKGKIMEILKRSMVVHSLGGRSAVGKKRWDTGIFRTVKLFCMIL